MSQIRRKQPAQNGAVLSGTNALKFNLALLDQSLARDSLAEFVRQAWHIIEPITPLLWNWHLDAICEHLEAVANTDLVRLIVNLPPRSGKSLVASVLWPAWVWTKQASTRWLCASYSASLAVKFSIDRRTVITSQWYQERWPILLAGDQNQKQEFMNDMRGHMIATSPSGTATGKGGEIIVADDLQNPEMAESEAERRNVIRFFDETLSTRLDDKRRGRIVVIQQRTHQADLTGHLLEQGGWTLLRLPAEFERRTVISLPRTGRSIVKQEGDLLWPDREGRAELTAAKHRLGSFGYASQYLQNPIARGGNLFKEKWFGTYREIPKFDALVQSWDCAFKTGQTSDYSACVTIGHVDWSEGGSASAPGYYLVHAWRGRVEFAELKRHALALYEQWQPTDVLIEDAASGQSLLQELRTTLLPISGVKPDGDKFARAASITPAMEGGHFWLLEGASWSEDYLAEMTAFPGAAHDDLVDATVQALTFLRQPPEHAIVEFYRNQVIAASTGTADAFAQGWELDDIYENTRLRIEAGYCRVCHTSLFEKASVDDGLGQLCIPCSKRKA
jgi:predicted phage terminase large subunit-like protein